MAALTEKEAMFYAYHGLLTQLHEFEQALPMFNKDPKLQTARARARTENNRYFKLMNQYLNNADKDMIGEASAALGQALMCSVMNPILTTETLDQLWDKVKPANYVAPKLENL